VEEVEAEAPAAADGGEDDLTLVYGIGPARATRLREAGIVTFAALAAADEAQLREILAGVGPGGFDPSSWPRQARLAARGDWEGLEAFKEQLRAERG
jgi:predicted flap endonuclease-1-like 5' DNA nuclease